MSKNINKILGFTLAGLFLAVLIGGTWLSRELRKYEENDPRAWKKDIRQLTKDDRKMNFPDNAVLFVGSSSIRLWETLAEDMHPTPVIQRGFGGAKGLKAKCFRPDAPRYLPRGACRGTRLTSIA